jgi:hypothetical protein
VTTEGRSEHELILSRPLTKDQVAYINAFCGTRRVARHKREVNDLPDPLRAAVGLPVGELGDFYVADEIAGVIDGTTPPGHRVYRRDFMHRLFDAEGWETRKACEEETPHSAHGCEYVTIYVIHKGYESDFPEFFMRIQPSVSCHWQPSEDGTTLMWTEQNPRDDRQAWAEWIEYNLLSRWGIHVLDRSRGLARDSSNRPEESLTDASIDGGGEFVAEDHPTWAPVDQGMAAIQPPSQTMPPPSGDLPYKLPPPPDAPERLSPLRRLGGYTARALAIGGLLYAWNGANQPLADQNDINTFGGVVGAFFLWVLSRVILRSD